MSIQEQMLEVLKQHLLPEIAEIRREQQDARMREIKTSARLDVIDGRLDRMDERFAKYSLAKAQSTRSVIVRLVDEYVSLPFDDRDSHPDMKAWDRHGVQRK